MPTLNKFATLVLSLTLSAASLGAADGQEREGALRKRFAAFLPMLDKKTRSHKRMYAACLIHQGDPKSALEFIEKELAPGGDDLVLLSTYYRLAKKEKRKIPNALVRILAEKVLVRPFAAEIMMDVARHPATELLLARDCYKAAIEDNPLDPNAYYELGQKTRGADEAFGLYASALLLAPPGSELSGRILDALEKK